MKVKELIERLQEVDPELICVLIIGDDCGNINDVTVSFDKINNEIVCWLEGL